jgi:hypothetical protein
MKPSSLRTIAQHNCYSSFRQYVNPRSPPQSSAFPTTPLGAGKLAHFVLGYGIEITSMAGERLCECSTSKPGDGLKTFATWASNVVAPLDVSERSASYRPPMKSLRESMSEVRKKVIDDGQCACQGRR